MPLEKRLLLYMAIPAFLLALVGLVGISSLAHLSNTADRILSDNYRSIQEARRMERALRTVERSTAEIGATTTSSANTSKAKELFKRALARCESNITEKGEAELLQGIRMHWKQLLEGLGDHLPFAGDTDELLYQGIEDLIQLNETAMLRIEQETRSTGHVMTIVTATTTLAVLLTLFAFAFIAARRISRPVIAVSNRLHNALNPEQSVPKERPSRHDEILRLECELDEMLARLGRYEDDQALKFRELQDRFWFVLNGIREGVVLLDRSGRILFLNNQAARILEISEENRGLLLANTLPGIDVKRVLGELSEDRLSGGVDLDERLIYIAGTQRVIRPRLLPAEGHGRTEAALMVFWDITEERRFEESRQRFIAMLSHQLKTPITSLSMSINLLKERLGTENKETRELIALAHHGCMALSNLVSELIDAAKGVTPGLTIRASRVDVVRLLRNALKPLLLQAEEQQIRFCDELGQGAVFLNVDPVKFFWVITNAVGNALRYTPKGGKISLTLRESPDSVEIAVADTGTGIEPERLARIFEQGSPVTDTHEPGSHGLGLSIAREIVEAHGGRISIESRWRQGTTLFISMPK